MTDDPRTRIAKVLNQHKTDDQYDEWADCQCRHVGQRWDDHVADAVIAELGPIPDREFTDQLGQHWEWCGGVEGTWAWRITRLEPQPDYGTIS